MNALAAIAICRSCGRQPLPTVTAEGVCSSPAMCASNRDGVSSAAVETTDPVRDEIERRRELDQRRRDVMENRRFRGRF